MGPWRERGKYQECRWRRRRLGSRKAQRGRVRRENQRSKDGISEKGVDGVGSSLCGIFFAQLLLAGLQQVV